MSLLTYLSAYQGTLNDKTMSWLKSWSPHLPDADVQDLWMSFLSSYSGSLNDRLLQWARSVTGLPTASLNDALEALPSGAAVFGGSSLSLRFVEDYYESGAIGTIPTSKPFADIITFTRASGGGRFNASGVYEWLGNDVPRLDYDPVTLQPRGILIEEQRTNLLTYSSDLTNVAWSKENGTWANSSDSKFGSIGTFTENTATGTRLTGRIISLTAGTTYTHTERIKAAGRDVIKLQIYAGPGPTVAADFNLSSGTVPSVSGGTASITPVGDGWYDCSVTLSVTTTQSYGVRFYPIVAGSATYTGDGRVAFFHAGAQLEDGAFPTSHIPTFASQVTRSADVASVNTLSPWYNASEGTLFLEWQTNHNGNDNYILSMTDTTTNNMVTVRQLTGRLARTAINSGGVSSVASSGPTSTSGSVLKSALGLKQNDFAYSQGGVIGWTDTSGATPVGLSDLRIGIYFSPTTDRLNGHIRNISYYPRRLSDSELQGITA